MRAYFKQYLALLTLLLVGQFVFIGAAHAADNTPVTVSDLSAPSVSLILGLLLPLLVALFTKYDVPATTRIWVNMFLSAAAGAVGTLVAADGGFAWLTFVLSSIVAFITSALAYVSVYKPTGAAAATARVFPNVGVGTPKPIVDDRSDLLPDASA